ncbi:response regulator transcription factor [Streptomyces sp. cmx-4-9]|uniref:response regulator transcription factor n=1 Tax=Streptomyces sp. cmx-4-9 TaxID=2790941 RepID=UPI0039805D65
MTAPARPVLTALELETLQLITAGRTYADIGRRRGTSGEAAKQAMHRVMRKLGAGNSAEAVLLACRAGILDGRPQRHGDHAGYEAHRRRGEDPKLCPHGCWAGEQAHKAAIRRKLLAS